MTRGNWVPFIAFLLVLSSFAINSSGNDTAITQHRYLNPAIQENTTIPETFPTKPYRSNDIKTDYTFTQAGNYQITSNESSQTDITIRFVSNWSHFHFQLFYSGIYKDSLERPQWSYGYDLKNLKRANKNGVSNLLSDRDFFVVIYTDFAPSYSLDIKEVEILGSGETILDTDESVRPNWNGSILFGVIFNFTRYKITFDGEDGSHQVYIIFVDTLVNIISTDIEPHPGHKEMLIQGTIGILTFRVTTASDPKLITITIAETEYGLVEDGVELIEHSGEYNNIVPIGKKKSTFAIADNLGNYSITLECNTGYLYTLEISVWPHFNNATSTGCSLGVNHLYFSSLDPIFIHVYKMHEGDPSPNLMIFKIETARIYSKIEFSSSVLDNTYYLRVTNDKTGTFVYDTTLVLIYRWSHLIIHISPNTKIDPLVAYKYMPRDPNRYPTTLGMIDFPLLLPISGLDEANNSYSGIMKYYFPLRDVLPLYFVDLFNNELVVAIKESVKLRYSVDTGFLLSAITPTIHLEWDRNFTPYQSVALFPIPLPQVSNWIIILIVSQVVNQILRNYKRKWTNHKLSNP